MLLGVNDVNTGKMPEKEFKTEIRKLQVREIGKQQYYSINLPKEWITEKGITEDSILQVAWDGKNEIRIRVVELKK